MFRLRIVLLLCLVTGTLTQDLSLLDAFDDNEPVTPKPKEQPKVPEKPKNDGDFGFSLEDALGPDPKPKPKPTEKPPKSGGGDFGLSLEDALGPDPNPKPAKPTVKPPKSGGGGGTFDDSDLFNIGHGGDGGYKPDGGHKPDGGYKPDGGHAGGGGEVDPAHDPHGGADQPQDPDLLWGQILKMLNANMPEEFYMWMSNLKQILTPLLERAMDLLQAMP